MADHTCYYTDQSEPCPNDAEIEHLRKRIVMLLRCHYEEHEHRGSPTCFDVQSPSDEWEAAAVVRDQASHEWPS